MTEQSRFIRWVRKYSPRRGLICHFYIREKGKRYYGKVDFAYFNLFCPSKDWVVGGTKNHGISSARGKRSPIPCLNCFEDNEKFCQVIKKCEPDRSDQFEIGIIFNKRKLKKDFTVINVSTNGPSPLTPPNKCHHFDNPRFRIGPLHPFNFCDVVCVEIPERNQLPAIGLIPSDSIMGILVKPENQHAIANLLKSNSRGGKWQPSPCSNIWQMLMAK
jgi:hypothetical protein